MLGRRTSGSVVCISCGNLVGVNDETCYNCGRRNPGLWGYAPLLRRLGNDFGFVPMVVLGSAGLYVATLIASGPNIRMGGLFGFLSPNTMSLFLFGASGAIPVFNYGRWWTVLSAGWLHAGLLHILFNMLWVRNLGPTCAELYGAGRMVIIYTVSGVVGFAASSLMGVLLAGVPIGFLRGAGFTVGASAPIFGLLGALVYYGQRSGSSMARREGLQYALMLGVFGLVMPGIDNWAHAGGFAGGWLAGRLLDPLKPERLDHMLMAVGCLLATLVAIVFSIVHGLSLFAT
ncbi:MAG: rhomboid family intramembrane serine protease [Acidobacteriota bacterium]